MQREDAVTARPRVADKLAKGYDLHATMLAATLTALVAHWLLAPFSDLLRGQVLLTLGSLMAHGASTTTIMKPSVVCHGSTLAVF